MGLEWDITDLHQTRLASLIDRRLGQVDIARNGPRQASVVVALDDPVALKVVPEKTLLKVKLDGQPVCIGRISAPEFGDDAGAGEAGASVQVVALDPADHLARLFLDAVATYAATDQSAILAALVALKASAGHGVIAGTLTTGTPRDRTYYAGKDVWEAITQMSEVIGGPDFELEPVEATDGTIAKLNTFAAQGSARPAIFEYGHGLHNVAGFGYTPDGNGVCNRITVVGSAVDGVAPAYVAESLGSQAFYGGIFERFEALADVTEGPTLADYAREQIARYAYAVSYFDLTLPPQGASSLLDKDGDPLRDYTGQKYGDPPVCGPAGDFWIGDTITLSIQRNIDVRLSGRIDHITLSEDDQGNTIASPTCTPSPLSDSDVTGAATTRTIDAPPG